MNKIFILGTNNKFSLRANRWLFISIGLIFLLNGIWHTYTKPLNYFGIILGLLQIPAGLFYLFYAWVGLSEKSKYSPKASFDDDIIILKSNFWSKSIKVKWAEVAKIEFKPFQLVLNCGDRNISFDYVADANTSIAVKEYIRAQAENKGIEVIGG